MSKPLRRYTPPDSDEAIRQRMTNSQRSHTANVRGKSFEKELQAVHDLYRKRGIGVITKCNPATRGVPGEMAFTGAHDVDFIGRIGSTPVAFDAKSQSNAASFALSPPSRLKARKKEVRQIQFLLDFADAGNAGIAFLLIRDPKAQRAYVLTPPYLERLVRCERVPLRKGDTPQVPHVNEASVMDLARGLPRWDWVRAFDPAIMRGAA